MRLLGIIIASLMVTATVAALVFAMELGGLEWKRFFAPKHAAVRREVFKETRSYNEAKAQSLVRHRREYAIANDSDKKALAGLIRIEFAEFYADGKADDLPADLRDFLRDVMTN